MRFTLFACLFSLFLLACCSANADLKDGILAAVETRDGSAATVQQWLVGVTDDATAPQINEASQFLKSLTGTMPKAISRSDGQFLFWIVDMTEAQRDQALSHPPIDVVELNLKLVHTRVPRPSASSAKERRGVQDPATYKYQPFAPRELCAVSQPKFVFLVS